MFILLTFTLDGLDGSGLNEAADEDEVQRLVDRARRGDRAAAGRIYRLHAKRVFRALRPLCRNDEEAEEVLQDAFIKALGALVRYRRRRGARFITWLLTISLNTARSRLRRKPVTLVPTEPATLERLGPRTANLDDSDEDEARRAALMFALSELSDRDREIVTLRYGSGLNASEVGAVCGIREANVRKICQRRRDRLLRRVTEILSAQDHPPTCRDDVVDIPISHAEERP